MELYLRNKTNANGLILSSGFYDGINQDSESFPYLGVYDGINQITPVLSFNTVSGFRNLFGRVLKFDDTQAVSTLDQELLNRR